MKKFHIKGRKLKMRLSKIINCMNYLRNCMLNSLKNISDSILMEFVDIYLYLR